jgi:hypothetical protein
LTNLVAAANTIAGSYAVTASANGAIPAALTFNLTNVAGLPSQLVIHTQPSSTAVAGQLFATQPVVYETDRYGNLETNDNSTRVTASLHNSMTALQTVTVVGGIATFTNLSYTKAGVITLDFTSGALTKATSNPISIRAAAANRFIMALQSSSGFFTGRPYTLIVLAVDPYGNQAGGYRGTVQFTSTKVATLPGFYSFTAADNGVHFFTNGVTFGQAGTVTITVYDTANPAIAGSIAVGVANDPPVKARVAASKAKSRRHALRLLKVSERNQARTTLESLPVASSRSRQTAIPTSGAVAKPAGVRARHTSAVARVDAARGHILADLPRSLHAYLAAERMAARYFA